MTAYKATSQAGVTAAIRNMTRDMMNLISAGMDAVGEVREDSRTRNGLQNAKLHAMLGDISKQVTLNGTKHNTHVWKRLTTAEFLKDRGERPLIIQDLSGEVLVLWEKTSKMSTKVMAEYIEWLYAYGAQESVVWSEPRDESRELEREQES